ncbi:MAG: ROK family protein [Spartobacteria bacterium]|nr:ROK family protein [Spartobacteria bacterium]
MTRSERVPAMTIKKPKQIGLGVDFGGTFVKIALVNEKGKILAKKKHSTKNVTTREDWVEALASGLSGLVAEVGIREDQLCGMGVGVPGFVDYKRGFIHNLTNVPGWTGVNLASILRKRFGLRAFVDNDVNVMAMGECMFGAGKKLKNAVFVTLGTGVGGGIVINGGLYRGAHSMAGEIGHVCIEKDGIRSPEGRGGLEQYVGNQRLIARAVKELKKGRASRIRELVADKLDEVTPKEIAQAAAEGDALGLEIFDFMADCLAAAFASVTYLLQPEAFIVGGGVAQSGKVLFDPLREKLVQRLSPFFAERVEILHAKLGNDAGVIGGAALALAAQ